MAALSQSCRALAAQGDPLATVAPVVRVDFLDDDEGRLRVLAEHLTISSVAPAIMASFWARVTPSSVTWMSM